MMQQFEPLQQVTYRHEARGGYGYVLDVPAIVLVVGHRRIGIAALTKRGEWVPRYVKSEKLKVEIAS